MVSFVCPYSQMCMRVSKPIPSSTRPQHITQHKPTTCHIVGTDDELSTKIGNHITELLYDRRFCLQQTWLTGDYMIADNFEVNTPAFQSLENTFADNVVIDPHTAHAHSHRLQPLPSRALAYPCQLMAVKLHSKGTCPLFRLLTLSSLQCFISFLLPTRALNWLDTRFCVNHPSP